MFQIQAQEIAGINSDRTTYRSSLKTYISSKNYIVSHYINQKNIISFTYFQFSSEI